MEDITGGAMVTMVSTVNTPRYEGALGGIVE